VSQVLPSDPLLPANRAVTRATSIAPTRTPSTNTPGGWYRGSTSNPRTPSANLVFTTNGVSSTSTSTPQTSYTDAAQSFVDALRAMREQISYFVIPTTSDANRRLVAAATLPPEFLELTAVALKNSEALARAGADPAKTRDTLSYAEAFGPLADELEALAMFVRHSVSVAKNEAGSDALLTYAIAKRLAKRPPTADLAPHVADMRRSLGNRIRRPRATPAPSPASPGPTQAPMQASPVTPPSPVTSSGTGSKSE
jgi:hypothetical protein